MLLFENVLLQEFKHMIPHFLTKQSKITESMIKVNPNDLTDDAFDSEEHLDSIKYYFDEDDWTAFQNLAETKKRLLCEIKKQVVLVIPKRIKKK